MKKISFQRKSKKLRVQERGEPVKELHSSYFFNLTTFQYAELFNESEYVWKTLEKIDPYLASQTLGKIEADIPNGVYLVDSHLISIGKGTIVEQGAYIKGPCIIGKDCTIRHGAYIRGNLIAGNKCIIGHDTEIKNSILLNNAHAAHFAYLGDSILGNNVNLGAGAKCANLKLDNTQVSIHYEGQRIETGLRKLGAIIGDNSQIGCNTVTNPGTLFGKSVYCYPVLNVGGVIPSHSIVKNNIHLSVITAKEF